MSAEPKTKNFGYLTLPQFCETISKRKINIVSKESKFLLKIAIQNNSLSPIFLGRFLKCEIYRDDEKVSSCSFKTTGDMRKHNRYSILACEEKMIELKIFTGLNSTSMYIKDFKSGNFFMKFSVDEAGFKDIDRIDEILVKSEFELNSI